MVSFIDTPLRGRQFHRGRSAVVVAALIAASVSTSLAAADAPLTLAEAQRRAVERSLQVVAHDAAISGSRHLAVAAGQLPDPMFRAGLDNVPVTGPDRFSLGNDFMTMRRVGVTQELTRGEKRKLRSERFDLEAEKSLAEKTGTIATIQRDSALAWLDRYYAEAIARIIDQQIAQARLEVDAADSNYRAGRGNQADIFGARSAISSLEDRASEYARRVRAAKIALARWIGEEAQSPLAGKPAIDSFRFHGHDLATALTGHPTIAALAKQEQIAATEAKLASANKKADWSVELMYSNRGSPFSDMVSIGVSVPLQWDQKNRQDQELASKLAMAEQARALREDALRAHVAEVRAMIVEWESDRERRGRYDTELIPLARERTQAMLTAYRGAKASLTDVLLARRGEIDVRMQALQLEMDTARIWAQLNFLIPDEAVLPVSLIGVPKETQ
jgi:outer membrane protein TolC